MIAMNMLADLNAMTVTLTVLGLVLSLLSLGLTWRDYKNGWPIKMRGKGMLLIYLSACCLFFAWDAYCPDASQPHIRLTGAIRFVRQYTIHERRSSRTGFLGCIGDCGKAAPLLEFDPERMSGFSRAALARPLTVVYLGRQEGADVGEYQISAHPVVEIDDAASGEQLFYIDTTRHWPRVILLLASTLLCWLTLWLCSRMARTNPDPEDEESESRASDHTHPMPDELTALGLGGEDGNVES
ncbi:MAG: hypothetical protein WCE75_03470 [Terracidiphilus sp.]